MAFHHNATIGTNKNCVLALDASIHASYPGTGSTWYDLSPRKNHCSPSEVAYTPTFVTSGSEKYWEFGDTGSHENFRSLYDSPIDGLNMEFTVIAGFQTYDQNVDSRFSPVISCGTEGGGGGNRWGCAVYGYQATSQDHAIGTDIWQPSGRRVSATYGIPDNESFIGGWSCPDWETTHTTTNLYVDGEVKPSYSYGSNTMTVGPSSFRFHIGNWEITRNDMDWNGRIYFVYVYDYAMSSAEITKHMKYHAHKIGKKF